MRALHLVAAVVATSALVLAQDRRYSDPQGRFSFTHPADWVVDPSPAGAALRADDGRGTITITVVDAAPDATLRELADDHVATLRRAFPGVAVEVLADGPHRSGTVDGHRRVVRLGVPGGAVLETVFLRTPKATLMVAGSCPEPARAALAPAFAAVLGSVAAAPVPTAAADDAIRAQLDAVDAAFAAGVLTADEHAQKRAALERQLQPRGAPDPELARKLRALDDAHAAGVLDDAEHARKRAALVGAPGPTGAVAPDAGPPAAPARKGRTWRHPIGFSMFQPDGWRIEEQDDFLQLIPADPATAPEGPLELYFVTGDTVEGTGIQRPDDPQVLTYLDEQVRSIVPTLRRSGAPQRVETTAGNGCMVDWSCDTPDGRALRARCYVSIVRQHGVALVALGLPDVLDAREPEVRAIFASFGIGEGARDPALVGVWDLVSTTSIRNDSPFETSWSRAQAVGENKSRLTLGSDGSYERVDEWHMIAIAGGVSLEDRDRKVERGRWCAGDGALYLIADDQTWRDCRYRLEPGGPLRLATGQRGETWARAR